jgi:1-acyl-sn-glycerol-3-phosphate acyltransferase
MATVATTERSRVADGESRRTKLYKWIFMPLRVLFKLYFGITFFLALSVLYVPFKLLLRRPSGYRRAFHLKRNWAKVQQYIGLIPSRVDRRAPLPEAPYIICCNHTSYLDIIHMLNVVPEFFLFMGKKELERWPLIGMFFKGMNITVDRSNHMQAARAFRRAAQSLDEGINIAIFPEGTIPASAPRMKPFKDGAFRLAIEKQVPIVPVTFLDHWKILGEPAELFGRARPGIARAIRHPAIETKGMTMADLVDLRQRVYRTIEEPLILDDPQ